MDTSLGATGRWFESITPEHRRELAQAGRAVACKKPFTTLSRLIKYLALRS